MSVVGDFDAMKSKHWPQIFWKLEERQTYSRLVNKAAQVQTINESIETPDKANAFFYRHFCFRIRDIMLIILPWSWVNFML